MAFNELEVFPGCAKFGLSSAAEFQVEVVEAGEVEYRNEPLSQARRRVLITVGPGPGGEPEVEDLIRYHEAHGGPADGFRFLDPTKWKSCGTRETPTAFDQPLVQVSGAVYQLTIRNTSGTISRDRKIYKPFTDSTFGGVKVADGLTIKTEGVHYTVDYTTGLVTLGFSPAGAVTAGFCFHIPCRFDGDFPVTMVNYRAMSVSFMLKELPLEEDD